MFNFESKIKTWLNRHIIPIAFLFVLFCAVLSRVSGFNYIGTDFHYSLYDIPGNCNSLLYRGIVRLLMIQPDYIIPALKVLSYAGDFAVAFFALLLFCKKGQRFTDLRGFLIATACLLSPVVLIYSIGGMKPDSVSMGILLAGYILYEKKQPLLSLPVIALAAFFYPVFWPIVLVLFFFIVYRQYKAERFCSKTVLLLFTAVFLLLISFFLEGLSPGYFWGKFFVINPLTETLYSSPGIWFGSMLKNYGYILSTGVLLGCFKYKQLRIPALLTQLIVLMYVGWQMTGHLAVY